MLWGIIRSMRPHQWTKNALVWAALIFARRWHDPHAVLATLSAFAAFCALSSFVYIVNDLVDIERDRLHPKKRHRPIAAGIVPVNAAVLVASLLFIAGLLGSFAINETTGLVAASYLALSLLYQAWLKDQVILDALAVSAGFVLRAAAGATAIAAEMSPWLFICTIQLALFLALAKRRQEIVALQGAAADHRPALAAYSPYLLDQMIAVVTASTVMSYALYTISDRTVRMVGGPQMMYTIPFVIYGIFRYLYLMHSAQQGDEPDRVLLTDRPLQINILLYLITVITILSFSHPAPQAPSPLPL